MESSSEPLRSEAATGSGFILQFHEAAADEETGTAAPSACYRSLIESRSLTSH